jgi:hypothetical protein
VRVEGVVSRAIWITGRPESGKATLADHVGETCDSALDYEESLHLELRLHTHAPFRSAVADVLLLASRLHRAAAPIATQAERNVP